ncbi:MAG: outer membrane protein OmpA-like peptidoglycan-associated protein [Halioglobus sp.]|jgi:outer membrane protein OmpA-like peptidoglycan-associated protein
MINAKLFKEALLLIVATFIFILPNVIEAQEDNISSNNETSNSIQLGINGGLDYPSFQSHQTTQLSYDMGWRLGIFGDYYFSKFGLGIDADIINNSASSKIPSTIYYRTFPESISTISNTVNRFFIGIGPNYLLKETGKLRFEINSRFGIARINGGEIMQISDNPYRRGSVDIHLMSTGYEDSNVLSGKLQLKGSYKINENLSLSAAIYFMHHLSVDFRENLSIVPKHNQGIYYGESIFAENGANPFTLDSKIPYVLEHNNSTFQPSNSLSSFGLSVGVTYSFGSTKGFTKPSSDEPTVPEVSQQTNLIVTVRDEISKLVIPNADVAVLDENNVIVSTGTTNSYGAIEFNNIVKGDYTITGKVYNRNTTIAKVGTSEFSNSNSINKEILYTDQSFILKGAVVNTITRLAESNVQVRLTNSSTKNILLTSSNSKGEYGFTLDKNSSYKLVGIKDNRLSNIERVSTVGLNRSTTLFVNLELGVENFDCNQGTLLDIKYEFDSSKLGSESLNELDRLVAYMSDHPDSRVEFSAHTDSRGDKDYNQQLSQSRARSAVDYIMSQGINRSRIIAKGYGEERLLNRCGDGVNCSETEHSINRRTEAKLICN